MAKVRVLVYGTLKSNEGNFHVMQDAQGVSLGAANTVEADFLLVDLGVFPAAIPVKAKGTVIRGELFELDEENLRILDQLEGYPGMYDRKEVAVCYGRSVRNGETGYWDRPVCMAWMYFMGGKHHTECNVCTDGVWYPRIRREEIDLADIVDSDRKGPECAFGEVVESAEGAACHARSDSYDYEDEDDYSYYESHFTLGAEIEVDGPGDLHNTIDDAINSVSAELVDYADEDGVEDDIDYVTIEDECHFVGIEGVAANLPILKAAIEQLLQTEPAS